jgi:hypothetical protein
MEPLPNPGGEDGREAWREARAAPFKSGCCILGGGEGRCSDHWAHGGEEGRRGSVLAAATGGNDEGRGGRRGVDDEAVRKLGGMVSSAAPA